MTLDKAIEHIDCILLQDDICEECKKDHEQLRGWLIELKAYRELNENHCSS